MNQLENRISSREVAEMMEMEHSKLLRKIDKINEDFNQAKIGFVKYWSESSYVDGKGETRREFQITKKGCEFLAHKTTGTKGNLFTDKYMDRFSQMEQVIKDNIQLASIQPIEKTIQEKALDIILTLPNDRYKNITITKILDFVQGKPKQIQSIKPTKEKIESILNDFLTQNTHAILKQTKYGLAINKTMLYRHFGKQGIGWTETLRLLDEYDLIYHKEGCRTVQVRVPQNKNAIRAIIVKE